MSEYDDQKSSTISDFRIQLTMMEDIKDEILIGCRKQEDQDTKELESLESNLQSL